MRSVRARIFVLFAALLMLLPSGASARTQYYCRMTGCIVGSNSCANGCASQTAGLVQQIQEADCCQRLTSSSRSASLGTREALGRVAPAVLQAKTAQPFAVTHQQSTGTLCAGLTQPALGVGPPLFIVHCAFLS